MQEEASSLSRSMCYLQRPAGSALLPVPSTCLLPAAQSESPGLCPLAHCSVGPGEWLPLCCSAQKIRCPDSGIRTFPGWKSPQGLPVHGMGIWHIYEHWDKQDQLKSCFYVGGAPRSKDKRQIQRLVIDGYVAQRADYDQKKIRKKRPYFFNIKSLLYTKIFCWELTEFHHLYIYIFMFGCVYCENISCEKDKAGRF